MSDTTFAVYGLLDGEPLMMLFSDLQAATEFVADCDNHIDVARLQVAVLGNVNPDTVTFDDETHQIPTVSWEDDAVFMGALKWHSGLGTEFLHRGYIDAATADMPVCDELLHRITLVMIGLLDGTGEFCDKTGGAASQLIANVRSNWGALFALRCVKHSGVITEYFGSALRHEMDVYMEPDAYASEGTSRRADDLLWD